MLLDALQSGPRSTRPKPSALAGSVALHTALVLWMFFGPSLGGRAPEQPKNLYQQVVAGNEKKLVWYKFRDKLPEVSPLERHGVSKPPRAEIKSDKQTVVANPPKAKRSKQMVYLPAPPKELDHEVPAPNLLAFAVPELPPPDRPQPKLFAPPLEVIRQILPPEPLPDAPQVAANTPNPALPAPDSLARPKPKEFVPPPEEKPKPAEIAALPDAPKIAANQPNTRLPEPERIKPRTFVPPRETRRAAVQPAMPDAPNVASWKSAPKLGTRAYIPPPERKRALTTPAVPEAPQLTSTTARLTLPPAPRLAPRQFVPPRDTAAFSPAKPSSMPDAPSVAASAGKVNLPAAPRIQARRFEPPAESKPSPVTSAAALPDAPAVGGNGSGASGAPRRTFVPPVDAPRSAADSARLEAAPPVDHVAANGDLTAAIVGLNPAAELKDLPAGSHPAALASAPKPSTDGGTGEPVESARLFVPNLMIRDGAMHPPDSASSAATMVKGIMRAAAAPISAENIMEAARSAPVLHAEARLPGVHEVPDAPDPRLSGRTVYMVAIQMPNVTSFTGSWIMWFADREPMPGNVREMRPPVPLRKVDPKYIASAAAERIEGKVQLSAVIRGDGHVDSIAILKRLDDRLDFSAAEALRKWEFEPARRDGRPIDVDAIFEIPFRLEPVAAR